VTVVGIDIVACDATLGAVVSGVHLARIDDRTWRELVDAFHRHGVLIFPAQHLGREDQIAFSRRFGSLEPVGRTVTGGHPDIVRIANLDADGTVRADPGSDALRLLIGNMDWHADSSFRVPAAKASMLSCERPASAHGETEFADMRAAYDALDPATVRLLEGRLVTHSYLYSQGAVGGLDSIDFTPQQRAGMGPTDRPVIHVHEVTGRRSLCIGRHAYRLSGMSDAEAQVLLDRLLADACRPPRTISHTWQAGDLVWWDNRCVLHRARPWDYTEPRVMWHTRVAGDAASPAGHTTAITSISTSMSG
jgi:alpha-ketoglutarate-dependent taurine dioxygenase